MTASPPAFGRRDGNIRDGHAARDPILQTAVVTFYAPDAAAGRRWAGSRATPPSTPSAPSTPDPAITDVVIQRSLMWSSSDH
jgi:hypothetical protein